MKIVLLPAVIACAAGALVLALSAAADQPKPDSGKFTLMLQGKSVGSDTFRLLPDGCDSDISLSLAPGQTMQFHQTVTFKKGRLSQFTTNAGERGTMSLTLAADKSSLKVGDKAPAVQKLAAVAYPYGDRSPHLLAFLISAYDAKKGGEQKFDLVFSEGVGPQGVVSFSAAIKAPEASTRDIGGKSIEIQKYQVSLAVKSGPIAMEVLTDKDKHVLFWSVPAQKYTAVREGYQSLAK